MDTVSPLLPENDKVFFALRNAAQKLQELFEKYGVLQKTNTSLQEELKSIRGEVNYCTSKMKNLEAEKEEIAKEYLKYKEENDYKNQLIKDYEFKLKDIEEQNLKLRSDLGNRNDEFDVLKNKYDLETKNLSNLIFEKEEIIKERVLLSERLKEEILNEKDNNELKIKELSVSLVEKEEVVKERELLAERLKEEILREKDTNETKIKELSVLLEEKEEIVKERELLAERLKEEILREKDTNETKIKELLFSIEEKERLLDEIKENKSEDESLSERNEILRNNIKLKINQVIEKINSLVS